MFVWVWVPGLAYGLLASGELEVEAAASEHDQGDEVAEVPVAVAVFLVKSVFRVSSLIFFGFRHEECRPVVCFTGCPSCRT